MSAKTEAPNHAATDPRWEASTPEKLLRGPVIAGYIVVVLFFGGLGTWAALAPIASAVIAITGTRDPECRSRQAFLLTPELARRLLYRRGTPREWHRGRQSCPIGRKGERPGARLTYTVPPLLCSGVRKRLFVRKLDSSVLFIHDW